MATRLPSQQAGNASLILLHGLGETTSRFNFLVDEFQRRPALSNINIVLVQAPARPVTIKGGKRIPRWFDVSKMGVYKLEEHTSDTTGLAETLQLVEELIEKEIELGVPRGRVLVGGFSMGGAVAMALAATTKQKLGGFVCMSGFLPAHEYLELIASQSNLDTPILVTHGMSDPAARLVTMEAALAILRERFGFSKIEFVTFPGMRHKINRQCVTIIASFVERVLSNSL